MDTPREKIINAGPGSLEEHELLALIFSSGNSKENVHSLAKRIFEGFDREELLSETSPQKLRKSLNLGFVQTCRLMSAIELGKRFFLNTGNNKRIISTADVYERLRPMQYLHKEYVKGLYLNSRHNVIHEEIITIGSLDSNILHPREIFRPALDAGAYAVIIAHNHPSGDCRPSMADIETSRKLVEIGNLMQIPLLDHLIIGKDSYTSLKKSGLI